MSELEALTAFLDAYDATQAKRRRQSESAQREPFVPWGQVRQWLKCKPEVWARIRKMNPDHRGIKPYSKIRGYYPRHPRINMDVIGPREFIQKYGREAYRLLPKNAVHHDGHRKMITAHYIAENGA